MKHVLLPVVIICICLVSAWPLFTYVPHQPTVITHYQMAHVKKQIAELDGDAYVLMHFFAGEP